MHIFGVQQAIEYATLTGDRTELMVRDEVFNAQEDGLVRDDITGELLNFSKKPEAVPLSVSIYVASS